MPLGASCSLVFLEKKGHEHCPHVPFYFFLVFLVFQFVIGKV